MVLLESEEKFPLSLYLSTINQNQVGVAFAAAVIYFIPCLLLFLHGEQYLEESAAAGGIK